jgi:hypothetical protein
LVGKDVSDFLAQLVLKQRLFWPTAGLKIMAMDIDIQMSVFSLGQFFLVAKEG